MRKKIAILLLALLCVPSVWAQLAPGAATEAAEPVPCRPLNMLGRPGWFNQLEVGGVIGTTGIGLEVAAPMTEWAKVRAGFDWIPPVNVPMHFNVNAYIQDENGTVHTGNFAKVQEMMSQLGYDLDRTVDVDGTPRMFTAKLLVDVYPLRRNRHWRVTAGFYAGGRRVGKAANHLNEAPTLVVMNLYNKVYDYVMETDFTETPINDMPLLGKLLETFKGDGLVYLDPEKADELKETFAQYGRLGVHMGDFKDGRGAYMLEPGRDGAVRANAYVNAIRPYIGLGYAGALSADRRWQVSVDAGAQFWGGSPNVVTHGGVSMTRELDNVPGKVGRYLRYIKALKAYPTLAVKFSYTFF